MSELRLYVISGGDLEIIEAISQRCRNIADQLVEKYGERHVGGQWAEMAEALQLVYRDALPLEDNETAAVIGQA